MFHQHLSPMMFLSLLSTFFAVQEIAAQVTLPADLMHTHVYAGAPKAWFSYTQAFLFHKIRDSNNFAEMDSLLKMLYTKSEVFLDMSCALFTEGQIEQSARRSNKCPETESHVELQVSPFNFTYTSRSISPTKIVQKEVEKLDYILDKPIMLIIINRYFRSGVSFTHDPFYHATKRLPVHCIVNVHPRLMLDIQINKVDVQSWHCFHNYYWKKSLSKQSTLVNNFKDKAKHLQKDEYQNHSDIYFCGKHSGGHIYVNLVRVFVPETGALFVDLFFSVMDSGRVSQPLIAEIKTAVFPGMENSSVQQKIIT